MGPEGRLQQVPVLKARIFSGVRRRVCAVGWGDWVGRAGGRGRLF